MSSCCNRSSAQPRRGGPGQIVWVLQQKGLLPVKVNAFLGIDRVLFVGQSWPSGSDPNQFFTSINDAIAFAAANLSPTEANPVLVMVAPGNYTENVTMQSFVHVSIWGGTSEIGKGPTSYGYTRLTGNMNYLPTGAAYEESSSYGIELFGDLTYDATGKTGGDSLFGFTGRQLDSTKDTRVTGRVAGNDAFHFRGVSPAKITVRDALLDCEEAEFSGNFLVDDDSGKTHELSDAIFEDALTLRGTSATYNANGIRARGVAVLDDAVVSAPNSVFTLAVLLDNDSITNLNGSVVDGSLTVSGNAQADVQNARLGGAVTSSDDCVLRAQHGTFLDDITASDNANVNLDNATFDAGATLTFDSTVAATARGSMIPTGTTIAGTGPGLVRTLTFTFASSGAGAQAVAFPGLDIGVATYQVSVTDTTVPAVAANILPSVSAKLATGFTLDDGGVARTFDILVTPEQP